MNIRSRAPEPPYCWQSKEALRCIRKHMQDRDQWQKVSSRLCLYLALCEMASNRGSESFKASQKELADLCGLSARSQSEILVDLQGAGVLEARDPEGGGQGQKTYTLLSCHSEVASKCPEDASERSEVSSERSEMSVFKRPLPTLEITREEQEKEHKKDSSPVSAKRSSRPPVSRVQLVDENHIQALKKIYQPHSVDRAIAKCKAWLLTPKGNGKALSKSRLQTFLRDAEPLPAGQPDTKKLPQGEVFREIDPEAFVAYLAAEFPHEVGNWTPATAPARVIKSFQSHITEK